jgi:hypothetical protein
MATSWPDAYRRATPSGIWAPTRWAPNEFAAIPTTALDPPQRARCYSLFTLVGIAGEDDLDAPDLNAEVETKSSPGADQSINTTPPCRPGGDGSGQSTVSRTPGRIPSRTRVTLDAGWSQAARQQLLTEIASLESSDEAMNWARNNLEQKNSLTSEDARVVEEVRATPDRD